MIGRVLAFAGGLAGAAGLSQYPEFAQQYTQRLAGQVAALETVVSDFDQSAAAAGYTREEALEQLTGTPFLDARRADMRRAFVRYEALSADYALLTAASPFEKMLMPHRLGDAETFRGTLGDYELAMPLTTAGVASAGTGFIAGWGVIAGLLRVLTWPFRRRRRPAGPAGANASVQNFYEVIADRDDDGDDRGPFSRR